MASPNTAQGLVISGIALVVFFSFPVMPFVAFYLFWVIGGALEGSTASMLRVGYLAAAFVIAFVACWTGNVKLAAVFLCMAAVAVVVFWTSLWGEFFAA